MAGGLSAGLASGIGQLGQAIGATNDLAFETIAHGISGGIQNSVAGHSFGAGFSGGAAGNLGGAFMGDDMVGRTIVGGLSGGAGAWAASGDFGMGFQAGAYSQLFNYGLHEGLNRMRYAFKMDYGMTMEETVESGKRKVEHFVEKNDIYWKAGVKFGSYAARKVTEINVPIRVIEDILLNPEPLY